MANIVAQGGKTVLATILVLSQVGAVYALPAPINVSGNLGYNYRSFDGAGETENDSHLYQLTLNANSYIWQPWFANVNTTLVGTVEDVSSESNTGGSSSNETQFLSGELNLNLLPLSRTPFVLNYRVTDSRTDDMNVDDSKVAFVGDQLETERLELKQSYITEGGNRIQFRYDDNHWESSRNGDYDDVLYGLEFDFKSAKHRLFMRGALQEIEMSKTDKTTERQTIDFDHFYFPNRDFRLDSSLSHFNVDNTVGVPDGSVGETDSETLMQQASSIFFWRPGNRLLQVSGGVRAMKLEGESNATTNETLSISADVGAYYQMTNNFRLNGQAVVSTNDNDDSSSTNSRQSLGGLYQSDLYDWRKSSYQWYVDGDVVNQINDGEDDRSASVRVGHDLQRTWHPSHGDVSFSGSQSLTETFSDTADSDFTTSIVNSATLGWGRYKGANSTSAQLQLQDTRFFADSGDRDQQFVHLQFSRQQGITHRSTLTGYVTMQYVRYDYQLSNDVYDVTTTTAQLDYRHSRIFGIPRLRFGSIVYVSKASEDSGVDRAEWENRIDYTIGLVDTSASLRLMDIDGEDLSLLVFRLTRRF